MASSPKDHCLQKTHGEIDVLGIGIKKIQVHYLNYFLTVCDLLAWDLQGLFARRINYSENFLLPRLERKRWGPLGLPPSPAVLSGFSRTVTHKPLVTHISTCYDSHLLTSVP